MINPVEFLQYDKISDDVYVLGANTIVKFNVSLAKKGENGQRYHYHKEFEYSSNKYIDMNMPLITMKRSFDYNLTIESMRTYNNSEAVYIIIRPQDMMHLQDRLKIVCEWFTSDKYEDLYAKTKDNTLVLIQGNRPDTVTVTGLVMDKYINFDPIVINYDTKYIQGIRISLSSESNYIDISVDKFMGFLYTINNMNLYQSAQLLLNYIQRPEYGTNLFNFSNQDKPQDATEGYVKSNLTNRKPVGTIKQKSFFDKMEDL